VINAAHAVRHLENGQRKGYCKNLSPPRIFKLLHLDACHSKRSVWGRIYLGYLRTDRPKTWYTYVKQKSKTFFVHVNFSKKLKKTRNFLANGKKRGIVEIYLLLGFSRYNIETHIIRCVKTISKSCERRFFKFSFSLVWEHFS
jgi:hypothetical protein